jgi:hypothetical protein
MRVSLHQIIGLAQASCDDLIAMASFISCQKNAELNSFHGPPTATLTARRFK